MVVAPVPPLLDGARIPLLTPEQMSEEQRLLYEDVIAGPRGQMIGPLRAAIHSPDLAGRWSRLGEYLRFQTCLPHRLNELAIIICGRRWGAQVEWWVHAQAAVQAGLPEHVILAIRDLQAPVFDDPADFEIYEYTRLLQETGGVPADIHAAICGRWGVRGVVELTAVIGYYTMVAMTLNAHLLPVPDGTVPLPDADGLARLQPGKLRHVTIERG